MPITEEKHCKEYRHVGTQEWAVACKPWQGKSYIVSHHQSSQAAQKKALKNRKEFRENNPGGYGYDYFVVRRYTTPYCSCPEGWVREED